MGIGVTNSQRSLGELVEDVACSAKDLVTARHEFAALREILANPATAIPFKIADQEFALTDENRDALLLILQARATELMSLIVDTWEELAHLTAEGHRRCQEALKEPEVA